MSSPPESTGKLAASVAALLTGLDVDPLKISSIVSILTQEAERLDGQPMIGVAPASFGGSPEGAVLGRHAALAHEHVAAAMQEMVAGLQEYASNVLAFATGINDVDEASAAAFGATSAATVTLTAPDFRDEESR